LLALGGPPALAIADEMQALRSGNADIHFSAPLAVRWRDNLLDKDFSEPSGIVYHPQRGTLFLVGDGGKLAEVDLDGERLEREALGNYDLEGITVDPASGLLYLAVEGRERVLEVDPDELEIRREFDIERRWRGSEIFPRGGNGIESITFVPNTSDPDGGTFWVANQHEAIDDGEGSWLVELRLPLAKKGGGKARIIRALRCALLDIAGLQYLSDPPRLALISDRQNLYAELSLDGKVLLERALPGHDQEGVTVGPDGRIFITVDGDGSREDAVMVLPPLRR
jgi:hypothetical protein